MKPAILFAIILAAAGMATEGDSYNVNEFSWKATSPDGSALSGSGKSTLVRKAWHEVARQVDQLAVDGKVPDGAKLRVALKWRGKEFIRNLVAMKDRPQFLPMPGDD
jgi:hypothetical protein